MQLATAPRMRSSVLVLFAIGCGEPLHAPNYACSEEVACTEALVTVTCAGATAYALCDGQLVPILDPLLLGQITSNACYDVDVGGGVDVAVTTQPQPSTPPPVRNVWVRFADGVRIRPGSPGSPQSVDPGRVPWAPTRSFTVHGTKAAPTTADPGPSPSPASPTTWHSPVVDTAAPTRATTTTTTVSHPSPPVVSHPSPPTSHPSPPTSHPSPPTSHPTSSTTSHSASSASSHTTPSPSTPAPSHTSPTSTTTSPAKHH